MPYWGPVEAVVVPWIHYTLTLAGWSLCYFWIHAEMAEQAEHRHAVRAEAEALRLELEELRLQLDPHFLFNALNGVAEEIPEHPTAALAMLRNLTAYLRNSLDSINQTIVTVDTEVEGLSAYLGVQKARFGDRLRTHIHVEHAAGGGGSRASCCSRWSRTPSSMAGARTGWTSTSTSALEGDALHVEIGNTGSLDGGAEAAPAPVAAIGLENVQAAASTCTIPGATTSRCADGGTRQGGGKLTLEGEPCSGS